MPKKDTPKKGWKATQDKTKTKKKIKLALVVLGLIIAVILVGNLVKLTQTLFSPWKISDSQGKNYLWNTKFNINLAVIDNSDISIISLSPKDEKVIALTIPGTLVVEVPGGFGSWQLRAVYPLGETNKKGEGVNLLKSTLKSTLAIPIDGFLDVGQIKDVSDTDSLIEFLKTNVFVSVPSLNSIKTDLTLWELLNFKLGISRVRFDRVEKFDLIDILDPATLADGSQIYNADPVKIDSIMVNFADPQIKSEHKSIAVFNATDKPGLAQAMARIITNMGGNVIITASTSKKLNENLISGQASPTFERLKQILKNSCDKGNKDCDKIVQGTEEIASSRAEITVILGADFSKP